MRLRVHAEQIDDDEDDAAEEEDATIDEFDEGDALDEDDIEDEEASLPDLAADDLNFDDMVASEADSLSNKWDEQMESISADGKLVHVIRPIWAVAGVILMCLGLFLGIGGSKYFNLSHFISGFLCLALLIVVIMQAIGHKMGRTFGSTIYFASSVPIGLLGGVLFFSFPLLGTSALGTLLGLSSGSIFLSLHSGGTIQSVAGRTALLVILAVFAAISSFFLYPLLQIAATATVGAYLFVLGVDVFTHTGLLQAFRYILRLGGPVFTVVGKTWALIASFFVLVLVFATIQTFIKRYDDARRGLHPLKDSDEGCDDMDDEERCVAPASASAPDYFGGEVKDEKEPRPSRGEGDIVDKNSASSSLFPSYISSQDTPLPPFPPPPMTASATAPPFQSITRQPSQTPTLPSYSSTLGVQPPFPHPPEKTSDSLNPATVQSLSSLPLSASPISSPLSFSPPRQAGIITAVTTDGSISVQPQSKVQQQQQPATKKMVAGGTTVVVVGGAQSPQPQPTEPDVITDDGRYPTAVSGSGVGGGAAATTPFVGTVAFAASTAEHGEDGKMYNVDGFGGGEEGDDAKRDVKRTDTDEDDVAGQIHAQKQNESDVATGIANPSPITDIQEQQVLFKVEADLATSPSPAANIQEQQDTLTVEAERTRSPSPAFDNEEQQSTLAVEADRARSPSPAFDNHEQQGTLTVKADRTRSPSPAFVNQYDAAESENPNSQSPSKTLSKSQLKKLRKQAQAKKDGK